jgi:hypothetical protein
MRKFYGLAVVSLTFILCSCSGIYYAARTGNVERIKEALESGVPIESKSENLGYTALIVAAYSGKAEAVEYLCKKGADVNAKDNNGATALIQAAYYNHFDVAQILVKYNALKTIKDKYGNTALDYAEQFEFTRIISLLKK